MDFEGVGGAGHLIAGERRAAGRAVIGLARAGQDAPESHDSTDSDLANHGGTVSHSPALVGGHDPGNPELAGAVGTHLGAGRHPAALLQAGGDARTAPKPALGPQGWTAGRAREEPPAEPPGGGLGDSGKPCVIEQAEPEVHRVDACDVRQFVDSRANVSAVAGSARYGPCASRLPSRSLISRGLELTRVLVIVGLPAHFGSVQLTTH
jgi:hypothetical protein